MPRHLQCEARAFRFPRRVIRIPPVFFTDAPMSTIASIEPILAKAVSGKRLTVDEGTALLESSELASLAKAADTVTQQKHPERFRTYNIDRNINYTNICVCGCRFCAFSRPPGSSDGMVLEEAELYRKIEETLALGGDQILLQGGLHPGLDLEWIENLLRGIRKRFPTVNIHGFGPAEIHYFSQTSGKPLNVVLSRLKDAGLGSIPGGGAEILVDRVRSLVSPRKATADEWIEVCRVWHQMGGRGTATMMFGHLETRRERVLHFDRIRSLQDETSGFTAFIAWTFQPGTTPLASQVRKVGVFEYLKTLAVARLYLDNIANLQASWVTQGLKIGQMALRFGANDLGSLMIEENVVAAAGVRFHTSEEAMRSAIRGAGYEPRRRNVFYGLVD